MSDVVRVGVVAEGPTDHAILEQILVAHFGPKDVEYTALHPELSVAFTAVSSDLGFGWGGVFRWARSVRDEGRGSLTGSYVIGAFDVLVVHVDCDVARASYADIGIDGDPNDLPCALPCPPATATIGLLEKVVLAWLGEVGPPKPLVLCIPAQATEGWLLSALYPDDPDSSAGRTDCVADPTSRLAAKPVTGRLVSGRKKNVEIFRSRAVEVARRWPAVVHLCESAARFDASLRAVFS
jgi:hypothetical protein